MKLKTFREQGNFKYELRAMVEAHAIHVIRRSYDAVELYDLKLAAARDLERFITAMNILYKDLHGLRFYLHVIKGDDFAGRIGKCRNLLLEVIVDYNAKSQARIDAEGLPRTSESIIFEEQIVLERVRAGITREDLMRSDLRLAPPKSTTGLKLGMLHRMRGVFNRKTEDGQHQTRHPPTRSSAIFRLNSIEDIPSVLGSMQSLLSDELETSQSTEAMESSSQPRTTDQASYNHLQDYRDLKSADSLQELPSDLVNFRSNDTGSDVYEDKHSDDDPSSLNSNNTRSDVIEGEYEWPTLVIPERKMYTIVGEDRDYGTEEDLPEVCVPDPFNPMHSSSPFEDDTMIERLSSSSSEEIDPHAGENNSEGDPDDILRRISEVLSEHMIDRSEASTPEEYKSLKAAPGERI